MKLNLDFQPTLFSDKLSRDFVNKTRENFYELQAALARIVPAVNEPTIADVGDSLSLSDYLYLPGRSLGQRLQSINDAANTFSIRGFAAQTSPVLALEKADGTVLMEFHTRSYPQVSLTDAASYGTGSGTGPYISLTADNLIGAGSVLLFQSTIANGTVIDAFWTSIVGRAVIMAEDGSTGTMLATFYGGGDPHITFRQYGTSTTLLQLRAKTTGSPDLLLQFMGTAGTEVAYVNYDGSASFNSLTLISGTADFNSRVMVRKNSGADVGARRRLNFIEGSNVTLTVADDSGSEEVDITIASSGGGGGSPHALLDGSVHTDTVAQTVSRGSLIFGNATPAWDEKTIGVVDTLLRSDGTDLAWQLFSDFTTAEFLESAFRIIDGTHKLAFNVTPATGTRTLTVIDADYTIAGIETDNIFTGDCEFVGSTLIVTAEATLTFIDSAAAFFRDHTDPTKRANIHLAGAVTNTHTSLYINSTVDRAITFPDVDTVLAGQSIDNFFDVGQTIRPAGDFAAAFTIDGFNMAVNLLMEVLETGGTTVFSIDAAGVSRFGQTTVEFQAGVGPKTTLDFSLVSADTVFIFPGGGGSETVVSTNNALVLSNKTLSITGNELRTNNSASGVAFAHNTATSQKLRFSLSGAVGNNLFRVNSTVARTYDTPDFDGIFVLDTTPTAIEAIAKTTVRKNTGADVGSRRRLNLIEGTNITLTVTDDAGNEEVDVTIAATGGGGGLDDKHVMARIAWMAA